MTFVTIQYATLECEKASGKVKMNDSTERSGKSEREGESEGKQ